MIIPCKSPQLAATPTAAQGHAQSIIGYLLVIGFLLLAIGHRYVRRAGAVDATGEGAACTDWIVKACNDLQKGEGKKKKKERKRESKWYKEREAERGAHKNQMQSVAWNWQSFGCRAGGERQRGTVSERERGIVRERVKAVGWAKSVAGPPFSMASHFRLGPPERHNVNRKLRSIFM